MSTEIDELFGAQDAPKPRLLLVWLLTLGGVALAVLGMVCTAAPGGLSVLLAWMVVEKELDRVRSGYLPLDALIPLHKVQGVVVVSVVLVIALFFLQGYWLAHSRYDPLWSYAVERIAEHRPQLPEEPDPDVDIPVTP